MTSSKPQEYWNVIKNHIQKFGYLQCKLNFLLARIDFKKGKVVFFRHPVSWNHWHMHLLAVNSSSHLLFNCFVDAFLLPSSPLSSFVFRCLSLMAYFSFVFIHFVTLPKDFSWCLAWRLQKHINDSFFKLIIT